MDPEMKSMVLAGAATWDPERTARVQKLWIKDLLGDKYVNSLRYPEQSEEYKRI